MNKNYEYLQKYGRILSFEINADKLDPIIGRDDEIRRIIEILSRKNKSNPLLIGEAGVGKTAIVEGLAQRIDANKIPTILKNKKIFELDLALLLAGTKFQGEFEQRLKQVVKIISSDNDLLLFIDELHLIVGAGKTQGAMDAANIMKPLLSRGELKCIGATTIDEYHQYIEKDSALERRFQTILVHEPTVNETVTILRGLKETFESFHGVSIKDGALTSAAKLSDRYLSQRNLPDKAIDLIDEACAKIKTDISSLPHELEVINHKVMVLEIEKKALNKEEQNINVTQRLNEIKIQLKTLLNQQKTLNSQWEAEKQIVKTIADIKTEIKQKTENLALAMKEGNYELAGELQYQVLPNLKQQLKTQLKTFDGTLIKENVTENDIANVIAGITKIPVQKILTPMRNKLINLFSELKKSVKGQNHALEVISQALLRNQAGFGSFDRPIGSFFFLGSTGVGKTLVAKTLAQILFDSDKKIIRIDMSEYAEKHSISRLIGSPPGYVGYEQGGQLTEKVKQNPFAVILFDEFEKSHPEIQNLLLQILDEGHLTDNRGKQINFKNTIIIMTSNIASKNAHTYQNDDEWINELKSHLSPEFINRLDEIIVFNQLNPIMLNQIVALEIHKILNRIKAETQIIIQVDESVIKRIIQQVDTQNYGARPIVRYIEKHILNFLTNERLNQNLESNNVYVLTIDSKTKMLKLRKPILN